MTKVFTALLLADMAERGEVRLSDPAARYLPGARDAAGALYSTAADLARFLHACLAASAGTASAGTGAVGNAPDGPLAPAIRAALAPRQPVPGGDIGLAWHHARRGDYRIIWHNGMTGGFSAMIAFDPDRGVGVAALANSACRPPSPLDAAVMAALG